MAGQEGREVPATPVTIFGRSYPLRGGEDPTYLVELASIVDARMREVAETTGTADSLKVAILAALNLADECLQAGRSRSHDERGIDARIGRLVALLDETLAGQADVPRRAAGEGRGNADQTTNGMGDA